MTENWEKAGFGLYLHWPFCQAKCPYCDFNSHVARSVDQALWRDALRAEIARAGEELPGRRLDSIFFGGGTPSLMEPETVAAVIDAAAEAWTLPETAEITLEANPTSVESGRFRGYRDAGVTRVSLGVQALDDLALKALGRLHGVAEALAALELARSIFPRVSFDLIYARQHQRPEDWATELAQVLAMAPDHLSLYQLTIEPGTAFGARHAAGRLPGLPDDESAARMYEITQEMCATAGLPAYEVSNHARPGAEGRHNLIYWRQGDYVGVGPGAHGRFTLRDGDRTRRVATETISDPQAWLAAVGSAGSGESQREVIPAEDAALEYLMMSMRLSEGCDLERYRALGGPDLPVDRLRTLARDGLVRRINARLVATPQGRTVLNAVLRELMP